MAQYLYSELFKVEVIDIGLLSVQTSVINNHPTATTA